MIVIYSLPWGFSRQYGDTNMHQKNNWYKLIIEEILVGVAYVVSYSVTMSDNMTKTWRCSKVMGTKIYFKK